MPSGLLIVVRVLPLSSPLQLLLVATGLTLDSVGPALVRAQYFAIVSTIAGHVLTGPTHDSGSTPGYVTNLYGSYPQRVTQRVICGPCPCIYDMGKKTDVAMYSSRRWGVGGVQQQTWECSKSALRMFANCS